MVGDGQAGPALAAADAVVRGGKEGGVPGPVGMGTGCSVMVRNVMRVGFVGFAAVARCSGCGTEGLHVGSRVCPGSFHGGSVAKVAGAVPRIGGGPGCGGSKEDGLTCLAQIGT